MGRGPRFYIGGASERALALTGRQGDVYLCWIEPQERVAQRLKDAREHFQRAGREPSFGLRTHLVVRDSEEEAWRAADERAHLSGG